MSRTRQRFALAAITGALVLTLGACVPAPAKRPPLTSLRLVSQLDMGRLQPATQKLATRAGPAQDWWRAFGDAQLDQLVQDALRDNPNLPLAATRVASAVAVAKGAGGQLKPSLGATAEAPYQRGSENYIYIPRFAGMWEWQPTAGVLMNWELDFWGENRAALNAALSQVRAAEFETEAAKLQLIHSLVSAYVQYDHAHRQVLLNQERAGLIGRQLSLNRLRLEAGLDMEADLIRQEAEASMARQQVMQWRTQSRVLALQLAELAGGGPDYAARLGAPKLKAPAFGLPPEFLSDLLGYRPDLSAAKARAEAAGYAVEGARAQFYPSINLGAFVGLASFGLDRFFRASSLQAGVKPAVSLPILESTSLSAQHSKAQAEQEAARLSYNATLLKALRESAVALEELQGLSDERSELDQQLRQASRGMSLARERREKGLSSDLPGIAVQLQVLGLQASALQLDRRLLLAQAELARTTGGGFRPSPAAP